MSSLSSVTGGLIVTLAFSIPLRRDTVWNGGMRGYPRPGLTPCHLPELERGLLSRETREEPRTHLQEGSEGA